MIATQTATLSERDLDGMPFEQSGAERRYACTFHGGDHQKSLSINTETGAFICHACAAHGILTDRRIARDNRDPVAALASRRGWSLDAMRAADRLGLSPTARCRLSVDNSSRVHGEADDEASQDIGF